MELNGTCNIKWGGEVYDRYEITFFIWDLVSSNISIRVRYYNKGKKSFRYKDFDIQGREHIDINEEINQIHLKQKDVSSWKE